MLPAQQHRLRVFYKSTDVLSNDAITHEGGKTKIVIEDPERQPLTYGRLVLGSLVLGAKLRDVTSNAERVGVLLPNMQGIAVTIFGLTVFGRVPAMLNFTAGVRNLKAACEVGGVRTIVTARRTMFMFSIIELAVSQRLR